jgi:hypothetical protein
MAPGQTTDRGELSDLAALVAARAGDERFLAAIQDDLEQYDAVLRRLREEP